MVKNGFIFHFWPFWPFFTICACSLATPWSQLCFYWQKCYHQVLMQWYLRRESYSRLLPPHFLTISLKILFLDIFGHFLPFVPAHSRPLDPTSIFIDRNVITRCWCNYIYGEKATPRYYHPIFPPLAWKFYFWPFLAIFHHLCQRMRDPLIPSPFY